MNSPSSRRSPALQPWERIIIALDVDRADAARAIVTEMQGRVGAFKVGLELFLSEGPDFVRRLSENGTKIFLDLKFHDIPHTVANAAAAASMLGIWMLNVHASGGTEMMRMTMERVSDTSERHNLTPPIVIGVTVLTSSDQTTLTEAGVAVELREQVGLLAHLTKEAGLDGVVASSQDVPLIRDRVKDSHFLTVTPGIRPHLATQDDQKRVTTFGQALANGSNYVVIGRPITQAADRVAALEAILSEVN